ncbi:hypothetical protein SETIT_5G258100v2 [Setaria italica]|uniref:KIB1-4 beta-propeller domain-containing protein n=2 Tax=Setaria TaxID=4554 RepID=A0A368R8S8_SETIT|nr:hypothetical protein SETIT_5G258100v2 [Setaria italica]TKW15866.1 hypothetical protein SEVIR_5G211300v2 [Setaria viridis]
MDWTRLPANALRFVSDRLADPQDFVSFRATCPEWRSAVPPDAHWRFQPWVVESDPNDDSGNVLFYSPASGEYYLIHLAALEGRRVAGYGAGLLLGIDSEDELSAVLVNPLTAESTLAPRLPECFRGTPTYGFATDPGVTGENEIVVAVYNRPAGQARGRVALWRRRDAGGWATVPAETFWMRMPMLRARLLAHGPHVLEGEEAAIAAVNGHAHGHVEWLPGMRGAHVVEHEGQVRVLVRLEQPPVVPAGAAPEGPVRPGDPLPRVSFELRNTLDAEGETIDWANAPELHGKVIFQGQDSSCYVLPASERFAGLSGNFVYFLSWQRQEEVDEDGGVGDGNPFGYFLCKWDMIGRVATVVEKVPGTWEQQKPGRWFLPTFKY